MPSRCLAEQLPQRRNAAGQFPPTTQCGPCTPRCEVAHLWISPKLLWQVLIPSLGLLPKMFWRPEIHTSRLMHFFLLQNGCGYVFSFSGLVLDFPQFQFETCGLSLPQMHRSMYLYVYVSVYLRVYVSV